MTANAKSSRPYMPGYGILPEEEGAGLLPWSFVDSRMTAAHNYWVSSASLEGRPHAAPVWGLWHAGAFYFGSGKNSRKGLNLLSNPQVVVHLESGDETVILEGRVSVLDNKALGEALDAGYQVKYGYPLVGEDPTFVLHPRKALAWREADFPGSATRWIFED